MSDIIAIMRRMDERLVRMGSKMADIKKALASAGYRVDK